MEILEENGNITRGWKYVQRMEIWQENGDMPREWKYVKRMGLWIERTKVYHNHHYQVGLMKYVFYKVICFNHFFLWNIYQQMGKNYSWINISSTRHQLFHICLSWPVLLHPAQLNPIQFLMLIPQLILSLSLTLFLLVDLSVMNPVLQYGQSDSASWI